MNCVGKSVVYLLLSTSFALNTIAAEEVETLKNYTLRHSVTTTAQPETIWQLWQDVENWKQFDTLLEYSHLDTDKQFQTGATGVIKARGNRKTYFQLLDVKPGVSFTEKLYVPLWQTIDLKRHVKRNPKGQTVFTHEVVFKGRLRFLVYAAAAKTFKKELPLVMNRLKEVAEKQK